MTNKPPKIHNTKLVEAIAAAEKSEGYLVAITKRSNGKLDHTYFTQRFARDDIPKALEAHRKLLERELEQKPAESKEEPNVEVERKLPPEYREKIKKK